QLNHSTAGFSWTWRTRGKDAPSPPRRSADMPPGPIAHQHGSGGGVDGLIAGEGGQREEFFNTLGRS
ncbi:MAG: hypothetical protein M3Q50_11310, partial [Chloroflexota bacterium]|nr:hypothetical protein [Chloroflexota bacterium]